MIYMLAGLCKRPHFQINLAYYDDQYKRPLLNKAMKNDSLVPGKRLPKETDL